MSKQKRGEGRRLRIEPQDTLIFRCWEEEEATEQETKIQWLIKLEVT